MAKELDKAVEEKQKELEEERRLRQELADITEKVAQDMEVRALSISLSLSHPLPPRHIHTSQLVWRARIRCERCDRRERRPWSPPRASMGKACMAADSVPPAGLAVLLHNTTERHGQQG
jgi:hypothetical protein